MSPLNSPTVFPSIFCGVNQGIFEFEEREKWSEEKLPSSLIRGDSNRKKGHSVQKALRVYNEVENLVFAEPLRGLASNSPRSTQIKVSYMITRRIRTAQQWDSLTGTRTFLRHGVRPANEKHVPWILRSLKWTYLPGEQEHIRPVAVELMSRVEGVNGEKRPGWWKRLGRHKR
jgi:hypothetical protein